MNVKELIEELKKVDGEKIITIRARNAPPWIVDFEFFFTDQTEDE